MKTETIGKDDFPLNLAVFSSLLTTLFIIFISSSVFVILNIILHYFTKCKCFFKICEKFYSVLNAITGSFLDAALAGISPPINVRTTLKITSIIALLK